MRYMSSEELLVQANKFITMDADATIKLSKLILLSFFTEIC